MMKTEIRDWALAIVLFLALAFTVFYYFPPFFITTTGQACLVDYHCSSIVCPGTMAENGPFPACGPERMCVCVSGQGR